MKHNRYQWNRTMKQKNGKIACAKFVFISLRIKSDTGYCCKIFLQYSLGENFQRDIIALRMCLDARNSHR